MKKALNINLSMYRWHTGYIIIMLIQLLFFAIISFGVGLITNNVYLNSGAKGVELVDAVIMHYKMFVPLCMAFETIVFYIIPLIDMKKGRPEMLMVSLPVTRKELAVSRLLFTIVSSVVLVSLFTACVAAGMYYKSELRWSDVHSLVKCWLMIMAAAINTAAVASVAVHLGIKQYQLPMFIILFAIYMLLRLIQPESMYQIASSALFWTVFLLALLLTNIIIGTAGVMAFERRDI